MARALSTRSAKALVPRSAFIRRERANHERALSAPMHRIQMVSDPHLGSAAWIGANEGTAQFEKRACQYAAWIAERAGLAKLAIRDYDARYLGDGRVSFECYGNGRAHEFAVTIPAHVLAFDPTAAPLMIEGPEEAQEGPPAVERCKDTPDMIEASPCPALHAPVTVSAPAEFDNCPATRRTPRKPAPKVKTIYIHGHALRLAIGG